MGKKANAALHYEELYDKLDIPDNESVRDHSEQILIKESARPSRLPGLPTFPAAPPIRGIAGKATTTNYHEPSRFNVGPTNRSLSLSPKKCPRPSSFLSSNLSKYEMFATCSRIYG